MGSALEAPQTHHIPQERCDLMPSVGGTAQNLGSSGKLIQNLGPGDLYLQASSAVTTGTGLKVVSGSAVSTSYNNGGIWAISSGTSDVRILDSGLNLSVGEVP